MAGDEAAAVSRRGFLARAVAVMAGFVGGAIAVPVVGAIVSPAVKVAENPSISLGTVDQFDVGKPEKVDFFYYKTDGWVQERTSGSTWVVRLSETEFTTYDPRCTHLGCPYGWDATHGQFTCPCHGGVFSIDGQVLAGPPPRPLDRYANSVESGELFIRQVIERG